MENVSDSKKDIPDNENPWKIILAYAEDNLELEDKLSLRLACTTSF